MTIWVKLNIIMKKLIEPRVQRRGGWLLTGINIKVTTQDEVLKVYRI